jgi:hypothetical protein
VNNNGGLLKLSPSEINRIAFDVLGDLPEPAPPDRTGPLGFLSAPRAKRGGSKGEFRGCKALACALLRVCRATASVSSDVSPFRGG